MREARVYTWVYDNLTPAVLDETGVESPTDFPIDTPELKEDIVGVARAAFPPDWLQSTFENATGQMVPYVMGDKNSFTITILLQGPVDRLAEGIVGVVDNYSVEIHDYMTEDLIVPAVTESLGTSATLPYGITLTDDEISAAVAQAMSSEWTLTQFKNMINGMAAYVKGDTLTLTVNLADVKSGATGTLTTLADRKLRDYFNGLPTCPLAQFSAELATLPANTLPECRPDGYSYEEFKDALENHLHMTITEAVNQEVINLIPNFWTFNEAEIRDVLGTDMADTLDSVREFIVVDHGQVTDQDMGDADDRAEFDEVRSTIHAVRTWLWALWLLPILLLVAIGFLCGRNWKSRLLWALGVLFVTSFIFVIVVAVARTFVPDRIMSRPEGSDATQVGIMMADKGDEIVHNAINTAVWGLEVKLILCIVFPGLAIAGVIAWAIVDRNRRRRLTQYDPNSPPA
jgi:hypothetical protein